jgi:phosphoglycolate phosphatase-like HAD superfamily hydrolase
LSFDPPIKAAIFDCDGTLLNNMGIHRKIIAKLCQEFHLPHPISFIMNMKKFGFSKAAIIRYQKRFGELELKIAPKIFPRVNKVLNYLPQLGVTLGIVTNRSVLPCYFDILDQSGLDLQPFAFFINYHPPLFDGIRCRRDLRFHPVRYTKPDPRCLSPVIDDFRQLPGFPQSILVVGDALQWDYELARRCGFSFIGVLSGLTAKKEWLKVLPPERILNHAGELLKEIL